MWSYKYINIYIFAFRVQNPNNTDVYLNYNNIIIYYSNIIFK